MRHNIVLVFLFSLTLLAFGSITAPVNGQEAPRTLVQANAPGWITVSWEHTGQDVYWFEIHRQDPPYAENSYVLLAKSENRTDSLTDKNLKADTTYKYRVCAVYADHWTCSDWVSVRTLPPPPPSSGGSSGGAPPPPARTPLAPPEITATRDQDPNYILLDWSGDPGWQEYGKWGNPPTPTYKHPQLKQVELYKDFAGVSKSSTPFYDALGYIGQSVNGGGVVSWLSLRAGIRENTAYTFKVCFTSINDERKCSKEITASSKPVAPTAPADVTVSQDKILGNPRDLTARIRTFITARWRNPYTTSFIPGQFITLEREDRVQLGRLRVGPAWVEIKQISAAPNPNDPTEITVDTTPEGPELLTVRGNNYRVCAVVPALGAAGKVCSAAVSPGAAKAIDVNALAARGAAIANQDPLAVELRNQQPEGPVRRGFDIGMGAAEGQTAPGPGKDRIRDSLPPAEQGGFTTAVSFSLARNRQKITDLAPRGAAIANQDPLSAELRNQQAEDSARLGFDIGMAAAEGQTLPGPGKQRIHDSLSPAEQRGFNIAVSFSLERNRNADFAAKGAAIAKVDPIVAAARTVETDVFYWLGFDIATGIFGDPALGAKGNTATGPGSLKIRDSLSPAGQRGFNASVKLHLSRNYKP